MDHPSSIINLNKARKARQKIKDRSQADENAVLYGLPKAERTKMKLDRIRATQLLDGLRRDKGEASRDDS